ncbi:MAG: hypothetical protein HY812_04655 [Planctomycetes bacterium]|nr:hypothetical protein [Planctomycetota bacterium]
MSRLLVLGQRGSLLPAMIAALHPGDEVVQLDAADPLGSLSGQEEPALLLLDLAGDVSLACALIATVCRRHPRCRVVAVYAAGERDKARRALLAGADALLPEPFTLAEFSALLGRRRAAAGEPGGQDGASAAPAHKAAGAEAEGAPTAGIADIDALSLFVRGLAHEINNPLTTIRGFLQLLLHEHEGEPAQGEAAEAYRIMESESGRIAEVIQELEFFSGTRRPARTLIDLPRLVGEALKSVGLNDVRPALQAGARRLLADREQLSLALRHMFGYLASSAAETPPDIRVEIRRDTDRVVIAAAAKCAGAQPETPEQLLIPLYAGRRGDPGQRRSLACVFGIARAHGGSLQVGRRGEDVLLLRLALPAGDAAQPAPPELPAADARR